MITPKKFNFISSSYDWNDRSIAFETGKLAVQADSSITLKIGENQLLFTTCMEKKPDPNKDFMPLTIDFRESYSAAGRISGAVYRRREGRPSDSNILYARLTDRALRPMFPKGMINDVVISITPLALDHNMELDALTIIGSSLSVMAAGIPFDGPVGAVQLGYIDGKFVINPDKEQLEQGLFNLLVSGKKGSINMIECGANEVPEDLLHEALDIAAKEIDKCCDIQTQFLAELTIQQKEIMFNKPSEDVITYISNILTKDKLEQLTGHTKMPFNHLYDQYTEEVLEVAKDKIESDEHPDFDEKKLKMGVFQVIKHFIRERTIDTGKRLDDRSELDIRPLYCEVGLFKRVHGSGLFWRGDTQVLTSTTLGGPKDYIVDEDMENDNIQRKYFHHYNFPPFSVGEARPTRGQNRREIGHGKLAEKALIPVIPDDETFPYSIRTVSECLGSGGSTSMGSVCGSTLSLMNAGVPIKKPVSGIAMGLMTRTNENDEITDYMILNDLQGVEDFTGDMDFKVAGTKDGVTAIQLDIKLKGLTMEIVHKTISRAIKGYIEIMDFMLQTIDKPKEHVSNYAPKIYSFQVDPKKVKDVIGKGGETINKIIEQAGDIKIDFDEDGTCYLTHQDQAMIDKAEQLIKDIVEDLEVGHTYQGTISRVEDYGVFVDLPKGKNGLCHISKLGATVGNNIKTLFKVGDKITVKILDIDMKGRINLQKVS